MRKLNLLIYILLISVSVQAAPIVSIATMRGVVDSAGIPVTLESTFTISGVVTVTTGTFGKSSFYIQDETAGTNVYDSGKRLQGYAAQNKFLQIGTTMTITGLVWSYNGLLEFIPTEIPAFSTYTIAIPGVKTVTTRDIALNGERYEGQLVKISNATIVYGEFPPIGGYSNIDIQDASGTSCAMRIEALTNIHQPFPKDFPADNRYYVNVTGIVSQYVSTTPYTGGYQILPRSTADIVKSSAIAQLKSPVISPDKNVFNPYKGQSVSININTILGNRMTLRVFDTKGRFIKTLSDYSAGGPELTINWDGTNDTYDTVPPGIYILQLESIDPAAGTSAKASALVAVGVKLK